MNATHIKPWGKGVRVPDNKVMETVDRGKLAAQIRGVHGLRYRFSESPAPLPEREGWQALGGGIDATLSELDHHFGQWRTLPLTVQYGLAHACFTVGIDRLKEQRNLLGSLSARDFQRAELDSHELGVHRLVSAQLGNRHED